jgi:hypothetical protein
MSMKISRTHSGYVFLVTVLVIGVIASATAASLALLGWAAEQNGYMLQQSNQASEYAQICAERTLRELRNDLNYAGEVTYEFDHGHCEVNRITGSGNENRNICISGVGGDNIHRYEIDVKRLYPTVMIDSWQEVADFLLCP